jgi:hypothetical protein
MLHDPERGKNHQNGTEINLEMHAKGLDKALFRLGKGSRPYDTGDPGVLLADQMCVGPKTEHGCSPYCD